jgi:hypothetical protein
VSCKDYDDDIKNLQTQIDKNTSAISAIQTLIQNGKILQSVESISGGIRITIDGTPYEIKNGTDGANGTVWTIGSDGYWYKDGVATTYYALGTKGEKGDKGDKGEKGADGVNADGSSKYYVPNATTGTFWIYNDGDKQPYDSGISFIVETPGQGATITAVRSNDMLTLFGVEGGEGALRSVAISLSGDLRSLVFRPLHYFDGIETIIYPWLQDTIMTQPANALTQFKRQRTGEAEKQINLLGIIASLNTDGDSKIDWWGNYLNPTTAVDRQNYLPTSYIFNYGPAWAVNYHMNPANSQVEYDDVVGWNVLNPEVINYHNRAAAASDFTKAEKDFGGNQLFGSANGVLSVGLQIANPQNLNSHPTIDVFNTETNPANNNTIALQVNSDAGLVTSDYALVYPEKVYVEGLAYKTVQQYSVHEKNAAGVYTGNTQTYSSNYAKLAGTATRIGDLEGTFDREKVHVWDTPVGALTDPDGAALELFYNSDEGIKLRDFLEIHLVSEVVNRMNADYTYPKTLKELDLSNYEEEKWGLSTSFQLVNYEIGGNITRDSKFAEIKNSRDGQIVAWDSEVTSDTKGKTIQQHSRNAIDREPLVQVLVKNTKGEVVLDGYILIHISDVAPVLKENVEVTIPEHETVVFDLCNGADVLVTNWTEFNRLVLHDALSETTKEDFDNLYHCVPASATYYTPENYPYYEVEQFGKDWSDLKEGPAMALTDADKIGEIFYYPNWQGTTNHVFRWAMSEKELEALTHHTTGPVKVSRWVRFAVDYNSSIAHTMKYPFVYIKLTAVLDRNRSLANVYTEKLENYWYHYDTGDEKGWAGWPVDVQAPGNASLPHLVDYTWISRPSTTMKENKVSMFKKWHESGATTPSVFKYYFAPKTVTVNGEDGNKYTITVASDKMKCRWTGETHTWNEANLKSDLQSCAIDYNSEVFNNTTLYAQKNNGVKFPIATIKNPERNSVTSNLGVGEIVFDNSNEAQEVLNAIGYPTKKDENNNTVCDLEHGQRSIKEQMRGWIGVVENNGCNVAIYVEMAQTDDTNNATFLISWQRPINLSPITLKGAVDANTNENWIYLIDYLKLYDWRGDYPNQGYMYNDHFWFWGYYNIKSITVDMRPESVETTMHYNDGEWHKLSDVTTTANLWTWSNITAAGTNYANTLAAQKTTFDFGANFMPALYTYEGNEAGIKAHMGLSPVNEFNKALFGGFYYANNGDNVTTFKVRIPITIEYEFGKLTQKVEWTIDTTHGRN